MADDPRAPGLPMAIAQALQRYVVQQEALVRDMWMLFEAPIELQPGKGVRGRPAPLTVDQVLGRVVRNLDVDYLLVQENRRVFESLRAAAFHQVAVATDSAAADGPSQWRRQQQRQLMPPPPPKSRPLQRRRLKPEQPPQRKPSACGRGEEEDDEQRKRSSSPATYRGGRLQQHQNRRFPWTMSLREQRRLRRSDERQEAGQWQQRHSGFPPVLPAGTRSDVPKRHDQE